MSGKVGYLIEAGIRVARYCEACRDHGDIDLHKVAIARGFDFDLTDRLPLCTNGDCIGMIRFQAHAGMRRWFLLTDKGDDAYQKHSNWMFLTGVIATNRAAQRRRRAGG